jgi:hypothetical protein
VSIRDVAKFTHKSVSTVQRVKKEVMWIALQKIHNTMAHTIMLWILFFSISKYIVYQYSVVIKNKN